MRLLRPWPRALARAGSAIVLSAWAVTLVFLIRDWRRQSGVALASDLSRYGRGAQWKGVYYRGEKIGFAVSETRALPDGYELEEDSQLRLLLMGSSSVARLRTRARVDPAFELRDFEFSLDAGTGPVRVTGTLEGRRLRLAIETAAGRREELRELAEPPALSLNFPRRLAAAGLEAGRTLELPAFDPATLTNTTLKVAVQRREVVWSLGRPVPAFLVESDFAGVRARAWITDVGEVLREESPMGLLVLRESPERATQMAVQYDVAGDMIRAAAIQPTGRRIDDAASLVRLRVRLEGPAVGSARPEDLQGAGQSVRDGVFEVQAADRLPPGPPGVDLAPLLRPEPFIESDDPTIQAEAHRALGDERDPQRRLERLTRHVHRLLEKRPTLSLPSAREVLRTRVGDCNEHAALFVALARAAGLPARIAVGLVHVHGAFYYHAWAEVFIATAPGRGRWLPVDPTLNQVPADPSHLRLARGGLDRQLAILPALGRMQARVLELEEGPRAARVLVGDAPPGAAAFEIPRRPGGPGSCWSPPASVR